jgi:hypothetical protein
LPFIRFNSLAFVLAREGMVRRSFIQFPAASGANLFQECGPRQDAIFVGESAAFGGPGYHQ